MDTICSCHSRRQAMRAGEMAQDRWGRWHWPIDLIAASFKQPSPANYVSLTHCPFCNDLLPNVSEAKTGWVDLIQPPPADSVGDGTGQGDGDGN